MAVVIKRTTTSLTSYEALGTHVDARNGVATVTAGRLRDIHGAQRLGSEIREAISAELRRRGLGHQPRYIPDDHRESVRVYRLGSPVGDLIRAVLEVSRDNDKVLRTAVRSPELVERIKALIEDIL